MKGAMQLDSDRPRVKVISSTPVTLRYATKFLKEYIKEEEKLLFSEEEEHSRALRWAADAETLEMAAAKRKVAETEPDIDPKYLKKLKHFCGMDDDIMRTSRVKKEHDDHEKKNSKKKRKSQEKKDRSEGSKKKKLKLKKEDTYDEDRGSSKKKKKKVQKEDNSDHDKQSLNMNESKVKDEDMS